jgi:hypothetical protein
MPKLYEYFGISVYFYADEHLPVHVHGLCGDAETVAEIITANGKIVSIRYRKSANRRPLRGKDRRHFVELVEAKAADILQKWNDVFVLNKVVRPEVLTRRIQ